MRKLILLIALQSGFLVYGTHSWAWVETTPMVKNYSFKFTYQNETLEITKQNGSYEEALEAASTECFNKFKQNKKINYNEGLEIINVCANPRT